MSALPNSSKIEYDAADNSAKSYDLALGVLRRELIILRMAVRTIAENDLEADEYRSLATSALEAIEQTRAGNG